MLGHGVASAHERCNRRRVVAPPVVLPPPHDVQVGNRRRSIPARRGEPDRTRRADDIGRDALAATTRLDGAPSRPDAPQIAALLTSMTWTVTRSLSSFSVKLPARMVSARTSLPSFTPAAAASLPAKDKPCSAITASRQARSTTATFVEVASAAETAPAGHSTAHRVRPCPWRCGTGRLPLSRRGPPVRAFQSYEYRESDVHRMTFIRLWSPRL